MSTKEIVDSLLKLLEIIISWPILILIVLIFIRHEMPQLIRRLSERLTEAPGGWKFQREIREVHSEVQTLRTEVRKIDQRVIETYSLANMQRMNLTIREIKNNLHALGYYKGQLDNSFSEDLTDAIGKFQSENNVIPDRIFGPQTYAKMRVLLQDRSSTT